MFATFDVNTAQLTPLSFDWSDSLRRKYIELSDFMKGILVNPYLCHRVNNAYKATCKKDFLLGYVVKNFWRINNKCSDNHDNLSEICPNTQSSRWSVDYELCSFILNHVIELKILNGLKYYEILFLLKPFTEDFLFGFLYRNYVDIYFKF